MWRRELGRPWIFLLVVALVPLLALAERAVRSSLSHSVYATRQAAWIWAPLASVGGRPLAFYAALDFDLAELPRAARLLATADERMVVLLNGRTVAADQYGVGSELGAWDVTGVLRPGRNRLVAALASARGVGAFLASLELETAAGTRRLASGDDWRIFWRFRRALANPSLELDEGARPHVWGVPPVGRWSGPLGSRERPLFSDLVTAPPMDPRETFAWTAGGWRPATPASDAPPGQLLLDWGREVTGYLALSYRAADPPPTAVYYGARIPDPIRQPPGAIVALPAGGRHWHDARARTFRYALVVGGVAPRRAALLAADASRLELTDEPQAVRGAFGLKPPRLRTAIENEIWSEVERLQGGGGGEVR